MVRKLRDRFRERISLLYFSIIVSIWTLMAYNLPVFQFAYEHATIDTLPKVFLIACLAVIMVALNLMMTYLLLFLTRMVGRVILAVTLTVNALAEYFVFNYSTILDDSMLGNVFNTRYSEASEFFSWSLVGYVIVFGLLPAIYVIIQPINFGKKKRLGMVCGSSLGLSLLLILVNINQTLWIGRYDTELGGLAMPWSYLVNTARLTAMHHANNEEEILLPDGEITDNDKAAVVLVIGESARKANFQLYGYKRETNPLLSKQDGIEVLAAQSCATYTTAGVRAILEPKSTSELYEILPNYLYRMGVDVAWRSGNWGEPPVHIADNKNRAALGELFPGEDVEMDGILFKGLRQRIESSKKNKVLIVLHTSTSHGPDYGKRHPDSFKRFLPVLDNVEEAEKYPEKLVNAYDNSILYTDYLLSSLIDSLKDMKGWKSAVIFVSDHGESLGENNLFMHGVPMKMAPKEQYEIPLIVWTSPGYRTLKPTGKDGEESKVLPAVVDQHYIYHSVLNLLSLKTPAYQPERDIFIEEKGK